MEKIKTLYKQYINWVVIVLVLLLGFKSCQSCSRSRQIAYQHQQDMIVTDSVSRDMKHFTRKIDSLEQELKLQNEKNNLLRRENDILKETNSYYKQTNKKLIDNINIDN